MVRAVGKSRASAPLSGRAAPIQARVRTRTGSTSRNTAVRSARGSRPADAPRIMVSLNAEHRHIASLLDALARQSDGLLPGRTPDLGMARDIVGYLNDFPDEYHHPREDLLFGILSHRDPGSMEVIGRLQDAHVEIYRRSRELLDLLDREFHLDDDTERRRLKYLFDRYIGFYRDHINLEEGVVFPRATEKLRREDWAEVNAGSREVDDPLFGHRVRKEYRRLSLYLSTRVERVGEEIAIAEVFGVEAIVEGAVAVVGAAAEIRDILDQRVRSALGECLSILGERQQPVGIDTLFRLPLAVAGSVRNHAGAGAQEVSAVVGRTRGELTESVTIRLRYLRRLLG